MNYSNINETIYTETIQDLRAKIESEHKSVKNFCDLHNIDRFNLYKVFNGTRGQ